MATKKKAASKSKSGSAKTGSAKQKLFQTDDPIIVKPGGSLTIEFEDAFVRQSKPKPTREKHKHSRASQLTEVVIQYSDGSEERFELGPGDAVQICYDKVRDCP